MCLTDLDLDRPEVADHEEQASGPEPEPDPVDGRYAGVAWGRAERLEATAAATAG